MKLACTCDEINSRHCQYHQEIADLQKSYSRALIMLDEMARALEDSKQIILDREKELDSAQYITVAEVECCIDDALESYRKFKGD